jgi:phosphoribosylformimino-5-aminoimidazole carboxamide ribotide isomerase
VGVDVANGMVKVKGWQEQTQQNGLDLISRLHDQGIQWVIYTDISRDGTLTGPNMLALKELVRFKDMHVISSGGVASLTDLQVIGREAPFVWGVILGKALYEKRIDLARALELYKQKTR